MLLPEWDTHKADNVITSPNTSDESQFHQPPHVPSCRAHQLPIHSAIRLMSTTSHTKKAGRLRCNTSSKHLRGYKKELELLIAKIIKEVLE